MAGPYILKLLGGVSLAGPDGPLEGRVVQHRRLALLALLATARDRSVSRDNLIATLWPESSVERARHSLSDALHVLHKALGERSIVAAGDELRLDPTVVVSDVAAFEAAVEGGDFERAVDLYEGPFLDGFFVSGALEFGDWAAAERERLARIYGGALERLAGEASERGDPRAAAGWWARSSAQDPYDARVAVRLMEALAAAGDRAGAIQHAVAHAALLRRELDAEADPVVTDLARRLRQEPAPWSPPEGVSVPPGGKPEKVADRKLMWVASAALALALIGGWAVWPRPGTELTPEDALPGIAIVPFRVGDQELQEWREGMVDLLSTNLDGAGGLRAIDSRTVLARWREAIPESGEPDLSVTLDIARRTGASYAVVGTAIAVGPEIRLSADVYDLESRTSVGEAQVTGLPDSISVLVDRLSIEILKAILPSGTKHFPSFRLAGITTTSVAALKAYLEGESLSRRGARLEAISAFERAIEADSTFALAHSGLADAWWAPTAMSARKRRTSLRRAFALVDGLPEREAILVRSRYAFDSSNPYLARELLQRAVRTYPDDPRMWKMLGELYVHYGAQILAREGGNWQAHAERAVRLDPSNAVYLIHLVEDAFHNGDRARAWSLTQQISRLAGTDFQAQVGSIAFALVFGDPASRAHATAAIDTIDTYDLRFAAVNFMTHPRALPLAEDLLRKIESRPDFRDSDRIFLFHVLVAQGKLKAAREIDIDISSIPEDDRGYWVYILYKYHELPGEGAVSSTLLEEALSAAAPDTLAWLFEGFYAADRGRWDDHAAVMQRLQGGARNAVASGDTVRGRVLRGAADALEAYGEWRHGRPQKAVSQLVKARADVVSDDSSLYWNRLIRYWLGSLFLELDQPATAAQYFESLWDEHLSYHRDPYIAYEVARLRERLGRKREAIQAYEYVVVGLRNADPELRPRIDAARRAITRLSRADE